jgi:hypothetical protein
MYYGLGPIGNYAFLVNICLLIPTFLLLLRCFVFVHFQLKSEREGCRLAAEVTKNGRKIKKNIF